MILHKTIHVTVRNKVAVEDSGTQYICDNSDFVVVFDFDDEWEAFAFKTARFAYEEKYQDVIFQGNECPVPIITNTNRIRIGVYGGNLCTTTSASVFARKSILCGTGKVEVPAEDVYAQIMEKLNNLETATVSPEAISSAVTAYLEENPVDPLPEGGMVGQVLTKTENGAGWEDVAIPKEYGLVTYDQDKTILVS